jgi:putative colanic acid biosynthesis UDP-glucose lipid carrier transferase
MKTPLHIITDPLLVALAGLLAYVLRWGRIDAEFSYLLAITLGAMATPVALYLSGSYGRQASMGRGARSLSVVGGVLLLALLLSALSVITKTSSEFSRIWMFSWTLLATIGLLAVRRQDRGETQASVNATRVLVCDHAGRASSFIQAHPELERIVDTVLSIGERASITQMGRGNLEPSTEDCENWRSYLVANSHRYDEIWLLGTRNDPSDLLPAILQLTATPVRYHFDPETSRLLQHPLRTTSQGVSVELHASPLDTHGRILKSLIDRTLAAIGVVVALPLLALISVLIRLESAGPVLFRQQRHGLNGRPIPVYKFRTMVAGSDDGVQATAGDHRVTRVGGFLRRYSLDELPQLINVLLGQMSLVGPRPHPMTLNHQFMHEVDALMQRHKVKPGITGWAQINGLRGATTTPDDMARRIAHDIYYIEHWSLWLDLKILVLTLIRGWTGDNAY